MDINRNIYSNSSNFSFNHREKIQTKKLLSNIDPNSDYLENRKNHNQSTIGNLDKTRSLNKSMINLSFYNNIQDSYFSFILLLKEFVKLDTKIDNYKEKIAISEDLELNDIFKFFDVNYKGYFLFEDFKQGINNLEINPDMYTLKSLFKYIDRDNDNFVTYNEFCDFISPRNSLLSAEFRNKELDNNKAFYFSS